MSTNPYNKDSALAARLLYEYEKYPTFIIGVDFDNTIQSTNKKDCYEDIVSLLQECSKRPKMILCLWSVCLDAEDLERKLQFCKDNQINIQYVNESPIQYGNNRKAYFNVLLDDRAGLCEVYKALKFVLQHGN